MESKKSSTFPPPFFGHVWQISRSLEHSKCVVCCSFAVGERNNFLSKCALLVYPVENVTSSTLESDALSACFCWRLLPIQHKSQWVLRKPTPFCSNIYFLINPFQSEYLQKVTSPKSVKCDFIQVICEKVANLLIYAFTFWTCWRSFPAWTCSLASPRWSPWSVCPSLPELVSAGLSRT